jgi:DnaJ-class molecular chaperone
MRKRNYYEILGVSKKASSSDIKKAYYKLAFKFHPDVSIDKKFSEEKFKEVEEAYSTLSDQNKRYEYDTSLIKKELCSKGKNPRKPDFYNMQDIVDEFVEGL